VEPREWLSDFVRKGRDGHQAVKLSPTDLDRVEAWCTFCCPGMHADPQDAALPPSESEIRKQVGDVLAFVQA
jgi:hypothetical protein